MLARHLGKVFLFFGHCTAPGLPELQVRLAKALRNAQDGSVGVALAGQQLGWMILASPFHFGIFCGTGTVSRSGCQSRGITVPDIPRFTGAFPQRLRVFKVILKTPQNSFIAVLSPMFCLHSPRAAPCPPETTSKTLVAFVFYKESSKTPELDKEMKFILEIIMVWRRATEYPELQGAHKDHGVQLLSQHHARRYSV